MSIINNAINAPLPLSATQGGLGLASPTSHGILVGEGTAAVNPIVLGAGQVLVGTTSGDPVAATLASGTGITITSVSGSITISTTLDVNWVAVAGTSQTMVAETGYITTNAALTTFTLPASATVGQQFNIAGYGTGLWKIVTANVTQQIQFGNTITTASTGSITSNAVGDAIAFICVSATNQIFMVIASQGNLTVA